MLLLWASCHLKMYKTRLLLIISKLFKRCLLLKVVCCNRFYISIILIIVSMSETVKLCVKHCFLRPWCTVCPERDQTFLVISFMKLRQYWWNLVQCFLNKFAAKLSKRFPPHLSNVCTLPWNLKCSSDMCYRTIELLKKKSRICRTSAVASKFARFEYSWLQCVGTSARGVQKMLHWSGWTETATENEVGQGGLCHHCDIVDCHRSVVFTVFTDASSATDTAGISKHRLSPYIAYYRNVSKLYSFRFHCRREIFLKSINSFTMNTICS